MLSGIGDDSEATDSNNDSLEDSDDDADVDNGEWSGANDYYEAAILQAVYPDLELAAHLIPRLYSKLSPGSSISVTRKVSSWQERISTCTSTTTGTGPSSTEKAPSSNATSNATRRDNKKRDRNSGSTDRNIGEEDEEEDDDTDESRHKKFKENNLDSGTAIPTPRLACPFFKRNPSKYCTQHSQDGKEDGYYRVCAGPGWRTVVLLKEHLKRKHFPVQCDRCYKIFKVRGKDRSTAVSELEKHRQLDERCPRNPISMREGISDSQWAALDEKRSRKGKNTIAEKPRSGLDKWNDIWTVLFPHTSLPATPWYENSSTGISQSAAVQGLGLQRFLEVHEQILEYKVSAIKAVRSDQELKGQLGDLVQKAFQVWSATYGLGESTSLSGSDPLSSWENLGEHTSTSQHLSPKPATAVFPNLEQVSEPSYSNPINDMTEVEAKAVAGQQSTSYSMNNISPVQNETMAMPGEFALVGELGDQLHTLSHNGYVTNTHGIENSGVWLDGSMQFNDAVNFDEISMGGDVHANNFNIGGEMSQRMPSMDTQWGDQYLNSNYARYGEGP